MAELVQQFLLVRGCERDCMPQGVHDAVSITDQEERQVGCDEQAGSELKGALPETQGLAGHETAGLLQPGVQMALQGLEVHQPQALEQRDRPSGQRVEHTAQVRQCAGLDGLKTRQESHRLIDQHDAQERQRDHHDHRGDQDREQRREGAPVPEPQQQATVQRGKEQRDDRAPQQRAEKRQQDPDQREGDHPQQPQQGPVLQDRRCAFIRALHQGTRWQTAETTSHRRGPPAPGDASATTWAAAAQRRRQNRAAPSVHADRATIAYVTKPLFA